MGLVRPHGREGTLKVLLLTDEEKDEELKRARGLKKVPINSREAGDLVMLGIGGFTPLEGFMGYDDWRRVCEDMVLSDGTLWPIPITLSVDESLASEIEVGQEVVLIDSETSEVMATMKVEDKFRPDKLKECEAVYGTTDEDHPGVRKTLSEHEWYIGGPVKVLSEGLFPKDFGNLYMRPSETRRAFQQRGWSFVAAFQTRHPMHRAHEYITKVAIEICDGVLIHLPLGKLKPDEVPVDIRVRAIRTLIENYYVSDTVILAGYPLEMRYAGPREALLHAIFRQNFGCSHLIVGRDYAGVGDYYGPYDAQKIFDEIPEGSLEIRPLKIDWTFYCYKCDGMATFRTCPHTKDDRVVLSKTRLRKMIMEGEEVSEKLTRPEVLEILRQYYSSTSTY